MKSLKSAIFIFIANFLLLTGLWLAQAEARPPFILPGSQIPQTQQKGACRKDPSIAITGEQTRRLENLERSFRAEIKPLWGELRSLRLETRYPGADPQIPSQAVFEKQMRISAIQARIEDLRFSYRIKVRSVFTKEQFERFPPDCPLKMERGFGKGMGRGFQRGMH